MGDVVLLPIVYPFLGGELHHGERGDDVDPAHPEACFCGVPDYLTCPDYLDGDHLGGWAIARSDPEAGSEE